MYHVSMRIISNHHDVQDVLITSFTKVFQHINHFEYRGDESFCKWIKTIVINESIRFVNLKKRIEFENEWSENELNTSSFEIETDETSIDIDTVYSILEAMPPGYRIVFNLFVLEDYSHKNIAETLNISEGTSKSQLRKARLYVINKLNQK